MIFCLLCKMGRVEEKIFLDFYDVILIIVCEISVYLNEDEKSKIYYSRLKNL